MCSGGYTKQNARVCSRLRCQKPRLKRAESSRPPLGADVATYFQCRPTLRCGSLGNDVNEFRFLRQPDQAHDQYVIGAFQAPNRERGSVQPPDAQVSEAELQPDGG